MDDLETEFNSNDFITYQEDPIQDSTQNEIEAPEGEDDILDPSVEKHIVDFIEEMVVNEELQTPRHDVEVMQSHGRVDRRMLTRILSNERLLYGSEQSIIPMGSEMSIMPMGSEISIDRIDLLYAKPNLNHLDDISLRYSTSSLSVLPNVEEIEPVCSENEAEEEVETDKCQESVKCIPFIDPFKSYVPTPSLKKLVTSAEQGVVKTHLPTLALEDVVLHNTEDDCWVIINGVVRNLTPLIQLYKSNGNYDLVLPIIAHAGKDISHWFDAVTNDILHFVHPITGVYVPYNPHGRIADVGLQCPSTEWEPKSGVQWWKDWSNVVAVMTKQSRQIRILNMLCMIEIKMTVCCEDTINSIQDKYLKRFNSHAKSYVWKFNKKKLDMKLTLDENGIIDESKMFCEIGLPETTYIPCLMVYFKDDLTEM